MATGPSTFLGMPDRRPLGSSTTPSEALEADAERLGEWFHAFAATAPNSLLLASESPDLPDATLSLEREKRLFSRTLQLVVTTTAEGVGPPSDGTMELRTRRLRRRYDLDWAPAPAPPGAVDPFVRRGLVDGARTMTNVRELTVAWSAQPRKWRLRLATLAGSLIGASPGVSAAVPFEPEDVDGLIAVLRAFAAGASGG